MRGEAVGVSVDPRRPARGAAAAGHVAAAVGDGQPERQTAGVGPPLAELVVFLAGAEITQDGGGRGLMSAAVVEAAVEVWLKILLLLVRVRGPEVGVLTVVEMVVGVSATDAIVAHGRRGRRAGGELEKVQ